MRDAAVAAINFSLSLMKGLIHQQISRLPFKCQASIQLTARGRKAKCCYVYQESKVTFPRSACCPVIRVLLLLPRNNRLLFDDFLSTVCVIVRFHSLHPSSCLCSTPLKTPCRCLSESFRMDNRERFTFHGQLKAEREYLSPAGVRCVRAAGREWQPGETAAALAKSLKPSIRCIDPCSVAQRQEQVWSLFMSVISCP